MDYSTVTANVESVQYFDICDKLLLNIQYVIDLSLGFPRAELCYYLFKVRVHHILVNWQKFLVIHHFHFTYYVKIFPCSFALTRYEHLGLSWWSLCGHVIFIPSHYFIQFTNMDYLSLARKSRFSLCELRKVSLTFHTFRFIIEFLS